MRVAIVHDWLVNMGGAENVIMALHEIFPDAPVYTLVYQPDKLPHVFREMDIRTSFIQKMPFGTKKYPAYLPLMPYAFEAFDLTEYDLVISSSSSCAKGVITRSDAVHICYCHTPMRYGWDFYHTYMNGKNRIAKIAVAYMMNKIRLWDRLSADRVDHFIANSVNVKKRIKKFYRREADVIYPPVDTEFYVPGKDHKSSGEYYLIVSRLVSYKKVDLAVQAFNQLGKPLRIVGQGPEYKTLQKMADNNIVFTGRLSIEEIRKQYQGCKAFLFPGEEDFGITPVEAQACGKPVIAYAKGGLLETVADGTTGLFFQEQTVESLIDAVHRFEGINFDAQVIRAHSEKFSDLIFKKKMVDLVEKIYGNKNS